MKRFILISGSAAVCAVLLAGFWLARRSKAVLSAGALTAGVEKLAAGWDAREVPAEARTVDIIICDSEGPVAAEDMSVQEPAAGQASGTGPASWFGRTFFRKSLSAGKHAPFAAALSDRPGAVIWTHQGYKAASREEMAAEILKALRKAAAAGAGINIVTKGLAAAPALIAVGALQNTGKTGGAAVVINKFIAVEMNRPTLDKLSPGSFGDFTRPGNLLEWVNIWNPPVAADRLSVELFSRKYGGILLPGGEILPGDGAQDPVRLVRALLETGGSIERMLEPVVRAARSKEEQTRADASRNLAGRARGTEPLAAAPRKQETVSRQESPARTAAGAGAPSGAAGTTEVNSGRPAGQYPALAWADGAAFCEKSGGRLPTIDELKIFHNSACGGANSCPYFGMLFWSSEESAGGNARYLMFSTGGPGAMGKTMRLYVRCVR